MKLESVLTLQPVIEHSMGNDPRAKSLALLVQAAFTEELDWNLELNYRDGFVYGELKQENGKPHGDIIVFIDHETLYVIDDVIAFKQHTIPEIMAANPAWAGSAFVHRINASPEWARKFVREFN